VEEDNSGEGEEDSLDVILVLTVEAQVDREWLLGEVKI
jgi:hypothetical protein